MKEMKEIKVMIIGTGKIDHPILSLTIDNNIVIAEKIIRGECSTSLIGKNLEDISIEKEKPIEFKLRDMKFGNALNEANIEKAEYQKARKDQYRQWRTDNKRRKK